MLHIPYKGGGPALNAAVGGEVEVIIISLPLSLPFIKAGRLRALALCSPKRSTLWPQLPTTAEAGLPGLESSSGPGMLAPSATPKAIIARIQFTAQGLDIIGNTPDEFAAYVRSETARWSKVIKASNIKVD